MTDIGHALRNVPDMATTTATKAIGDQRASSQRVAAIREVQYLCLEALDHDTSWPTFCELVRKRLEIETSLMEPMADQSKRRQYWFGYRYKDSQKPEKQISNPT